MNLLYMPNWILFIASTACVSIDMGRMSPEEFAGKVKSVHTNRWMKRQFRNFRLVDPVTGSTTEFRRRNHDVS